MQTSLKHLETSPDIQEALGKNENVAVCCGRMGPMCVPVYRAFEQLEDQYGHVVFRDMEFDIPAADFIRNLPECAAFMGLPFTVYFMKGKVVAATSSIQTLGQVTALLDEHFGGSKGRASGKADA